MKTPRELLLDQHRQQKIRLDAIRGEVIHAMAVPQAHLVSNATPSLSFFTMCWQELFVQCRRYWLSLGAAWALALALTLWGSASDRTEQVIVSNSQPTLEAIHAQQRLRDELLGRVEPEQTHAVRSHPGPHSWALRTEQYV
jgi:hypothetical protein